MNSPPDKIRVAVLGSSGFTGKECLRILGGHPRAELALSMETRRMKTRSVASSPYGTPPIVGPLRESKAEACDLARLDGLDCVLLCAPHDVAAELMPSILERVPRVIDLSAAFRLKDPALYPRFYQFNHPCPQLLEEAVFGVTEFARNDLKTARIVANPGCYVTAVLLAVQPLIARGLIDLDRDIIADCKSGVSGAGKKLTAGTHFASIHENFTAYAIGEHRHEVEIREQLGTEKLFFTPHLLPCFRGILATIHLCPTNGNTATLLREALEEQYRSEYFVDVYGTDAGLPCLSDVQLSNRCVIAVAQHGERVVLLSCLDNLVKGAAGQAIQNLNVLFGFPEETGLETMSLAPRGWR